MCKIIQRRRKSDTLIITQSKIKSQVPEVGLVTSPLKPTKAPARCSICMRLHLLSRAHALSAPTQLSYFFLYSRSRFIYPQAPGFLFVPRFAGCINPLSLCWVLYGTWATHMLHYVLFTSSVAHITCHLLPI